MTTTTPKSRFFYAVNTKDTHGDFFHCKAWGHVVRVRWHTNTPRDVEAARAGGLLNWGGEKLKPGEYVILSDDAGYFSDLQLAHMVHAARYAKA